MQAYRRIGVRRTEIDQEMITDARMELNLMFASWANSGPNMWTVDQQIVPLTAGVPTITLAANTSDILDAWLTVSGVDTVITSVSRSDYAANPNKLNVGVPTQYWESKTQPKTLTFWPVPMVGIPITFNYFRFRHQMDAALTDGQAPDAPYAWIDATVWGLADRLAVIYSPDRTKFTTPRAMDSYQKAADNDTEDAPLSFSPQLDGYFR